MDNQNLLIAIYQNTSTAMQSIDELLKKTDDKRFKSLLDAQYKRYEKYQKKVEKLADEKQVNLKDNSIFEKIKMWSSIQFSTLTNDTTRHLAELMLIGTVMGTLTTYKNKVDFKKADKDTYALVSELEEMEEQNFDELKKYLKG